MKKMHLFRFALCVMIPLAMVSLSHAMSSTDRIAEEGKKLSQELADARDWPEGLLELLNDPSRKIGWQSWFTGLPNDVDNFAFKIESTTDTQHLIDAFAKIKADRLVIRLASENGPLDPFSQESKRIPGLNFSIGNQEKINEWFKQLKEIEPGVREYGVHQLKEPPAARPPTLTIFVENEHVSLETLNIPLHIDLDTEHGMQAGWKFNRETVEWAPTPQDIVNYIDKHRARQKAENHQQETE